MGATSSKKKEIPYKLTLSEKLSLHKSYHSMAMARPPPKKKSINEKLFAEFCAFPGDLSGRLFESLGPDVEGELKFVDFANGLVKYTMGAAQTEKLGHFCRLFTKHTETAMTMEEFTDVMKCLYLCSMAAMGDHPVPPNESELRRVCKGIFSHVVKPTTEDEPLMRFDALMDYVANYCPRLLLPFEILVYETIFMFNPSSPENAVSSEALLSSPVVATEQEKTTSIPDYVVPALDKESRLMNNVERWALLNVLSHCTSYQNNLDTWARLYSSDEDGHSFNRFCHHLFGYRSASLILIEDTKGNIFGGYVSEGWKDANNFFANTDTFLFNTRPELGVFRMTGTKGVYCNTKTRNQPHGIAFGGDLKDGFHLSINEDFTSGTMASLPRGFEPGTLGSGKDFEVAAVEVWGLGGEKAKEEQAKAKRREEREIQRRRRIDRKAFAGVWDDDAAVDKFMLDLMGVSANNTAFLSPEELKQLTGKADKQGETAKE